jgi:predicted Zn-dependent protease
MIRKFLFVAITLFIVGCSSKSIDYNLHPEKKAFEQEDEYIMYALISQQNGKFNDAKKYYDVLYQKSLKKEYIYTKFQIQLAQNDYDDIISQSTALLEKYPNWYEIKRYQIAAYLQKNDIQTAKKEALDLVKKSEDEKDFVLVADIYILEKNYNMAFKYLTRAYTINTNEEILEKLSILMYVNLGMKADAISQLESHSILKGCSEVVCSRLLSYYGEKNDIDSMLRIAKKLYAYNKDQTSAKIIIDIYKYKKDLIGLKKFLEKSKLDKALLMNLYANDKEYKKAKELALELYENTSSLDYLANAAIFSYEAEPTNIKLIHSFTIKNLKYIIEHNPKDLYLNYLGYIMIDNDIKVKEGMKYVKEALKKSPDSIYYLDSLAWGYYKLKNCKKAYAIMQKISKKTDVNSDDELKKHYKIIKECNKGKK